MGRSVAHLNPKLQLDELQKNSYYIEARNREIISRNFIQTITMRLAASMVLHAASLTMNCPKRRNEDEGIRNKVVLEAERQMKAALDKVEKYAVLATVDKQELTFPLLNIKTPVQEAMDTVKKELAIPIPALIGQKTWREERTTNINDAIKALVVAINAERDKLNNGIRASVNKTYTYYMQQLNKLIIENKALQNENEALKAENAKVKQHISQLDENAVRRVTAQKNIVIERLNTQFASINEDITRLKTDYNTLWEKYKILVLHWNDLTKQPELIEAVKRVEDRKEQEAEAKCEEQARQDRYQCVLDRFISEGHEQLKAFSQSSRIDFYEKEAKAIYYGVMATATKSNIALRSPQGAKFAVERFFASMDWNGCGNYRIECVAHWTKLFATDEVVYTEPIIQNFLSFINYVVVQRRYICFTRWLQWLC